MESSPLSGSVSHVGRVRREGHFIVRPSTEFSGAVHRVLGDLHRVGFAGAPIPVDIDVADGVERFEYIEGDVAIRPYPAWVQSDEALASVARLMRRFHVACAQIDISGLQFNDGLRDPLGGKYLCHNDVCPENTVFRGGAAVAFLDFEYAAPGRPLFDLAKAARRFIPLDSPRAATVAGWRVEDLGRRLQLFCDAYVLTLAERLELLSLVEVSMVTSDKFVYRRMSAKDPGYVKLWNNGEGAARRRDRLSWFHSSKPKFEAMMRKPGSN